MVPIRFRCVVCQSQMKIAKQFAGKVISCPKCTQALIVPRPPSNRPLPGILIPENQKGVETIGFENDASAPIEKNWMYDLPAAATPASQPIEAADESLTQGGSEEPTAKDWYYEQPPVVADSSEPQIDMVEMTDTPVRYVRWVRFGVTLILSSVVPAIAFAIGVQHWWNTNRPAGIVCLSGALSSLLLGGFWTYVVIRKSSKTNQM